MTRDEFDKALEEALDNLPGVIEVTGTVSGFRVQFADGNQYFVEF